MPATYEPIASTTLGSATTTISFSSIPATYTDLVIVVMDTFTSNSNPFIQFNSDTGSNYSYTVIYGTGSATASSRASSQTKIEAGFTGTSSPNSHIFQVMSYANTNVNKTVLCASVSPARAVARHVGLWRSTSAITSVQLTAGGDWPTGTTFSLYGIKAA